MLNKLFLCLFLSMSLLINKVYAQNLYPVWNVFKKESHCATPCAYKNSKNELKIPMKYCACSSFHNGYAAVQWQEKWGIIDSNDRTVLTFSYDKVEHFINQYFVAKKTVNGADSSYIFGNHGKLIYSGVFGTNTFYRPLNRIILQPEVNNDGKKIDQYKVAIFDSSFNELITYYSANELHADFVNIQHPERQSHFNTYFVLSETWEEDDKRKTISAIYKNSGQRIHDSVQVDHNIMLKYPDTDFQQASVIDTNLNFRVPFSANYRNIRKFTHLPLYAFSKDKFWGVMDSNLQEIVPSRYHHISLRNAERIEGMAYNKEGAIYHHYTLAGNFIDSSRTSDDLRVMSDHGANANNTEIADNHGISKGANGKYQVSGPDGKLLLRPEYDELKFAGNHYIVGLRQQYGQMKYGLMGSTGQVFVKPLYDDIIYIPAAGARGHFILSKKVKAIPDVFVGGDF